MPNLTKHDVMEARQARYRRRMDLRVTTPEQAQSFVDDVGFCPIFRTRRILEKRFTAYVYSI